MFSYPPRYSIEPAANPADPPIFKLHFEKGTLQENLTADQQAEIMAMFLPVAMIAGCYDAHPEAKAECQKRLADLQPVEVEPQKEGDPVKEPTQEEIDKLAAQAKVYEDTKAETAKEATVKDIEILSLALKAAAVKEAEAGGK